MTRPDGSSGNATMAPRTANEFAYASTRLLVGPYPFRVWASDAAGNWASATGSFTITAPPDATPPEIYHTQPTGPLHAGTEIQINARVVDSDGSVAVVKVAYTGTAGDRHNDTMGLSGATYQSAIPAQPTAGTVRYRIYAEDAAGNRNVSAEYTLAIEATPTPPSVDYTPVIVGAVVLFAVGTVAGFLVVRRKKKDEDEAPDEERPQQGT
ncbi:MAG: hypothetical protein E6K18_07280 [Methanobacteriota archaeon]|nr:MAG: hypothetical protein E6K18_07280 [Euryarchaeota archaeon]